MEIHRRSREFRRMAKYPVHRDHDLVSPIHHVLKAGYRGTVTAGL
jgi:hypothetical protein